ncbi:MAG TPA: phosphotransferase, partial [Clostridia bacterium]|nr:phosphotransferase [Clostridia bacterium]
EKGYPALKPAAPKAGDLPLLIDTRWGKHYACAFKKAPGERVDRTDMSQEIMFSYGKALGNLHVLSRAYQPKARMWSCFDALDWARAQLDAVGAPQSVRDALGQAREELAALPKSAEDFGLVHNDFEPDNVFYDAGTGVCSAIDFEDGMYHFYALDVAKALDAVEEEAPAGRFEEARDALLEGYRAQAPLGREAEELFPLMRRFQSAYAYARIAYCLAERPAEEPDWMRELCAKLEARLAALEAGMCGDD